MRLYYEEKGQGEPLVLIMGFGAEGGNWAPQVKDFKRYFRCITFDNRGVGKSSKLRGRYTTRMMAADTIGLLDSLAVPAAHICGLSMGGAIAQQIAVHYPERVKKLILVSTWARLDPYCRDIFSMCKVARKRLSRAEYFRFLFLWTFAANYHNRHQRQRERMVRDAVASPHPQPAYALMNQIDACIKHNIGKDLTRISASTLIITGKEDIFTPLRFAQELKAGIKNSRLEVFPKCGHNVFLEDIESFNKTIIGFLKSGGKG